MFITQITMKDTSESTEITKGFDGVFLLPLCSSFNEPTQEWTELGGKGRNQFAQGCAK